MPPAQFVADREAKSPGIAAVLSFFICGLGQIYNGQISKGLIMMFTYLVSWMLMLVIIGFFTTPILWIWGIIDAYRSAERINLEAAMPPF
jgi:TM2 domain-containing membrane protein YozV